jgi:hypothetical protein
MRSVFIRGEGVAASCCSHLLAAAGFRLAIEKTNRPKLPAIMLGEATQSLFRDAFGRADLFFGLPRIERRVVAWGPNAEPLTLPHSAVVVSELELLDRLDTQSLPAADAKDNVETEWTILAARPLPASSVEHHFGSRIASALPVKLKSGTDFASCCVESLEDGWLFLIPTGLEAAWLLSVGSAPQSLLARSRVVGNHIETSAGVVAKFPAYPRIASPLCGSGWLACGTAALAFDPLCGDGTGHAIREAILAAAVVRAIATGAGPDAVIAHYRARLLAGFKRHLEACREFYETGGSGWWWDAELELVRQGIEWCGRELGNDGRFQFQLRGFELQLVE